MRKKQCLHYHKNFLLIDLAHHKQYCSLYYCQPCRTKFDKERDVTSKLAQQTGSQEHPWKPADVATTGPEAFRPPSIKTTRRLAVPGTANVAGRDSSRKTETFISQYAMAQSFCPIVLDAGNNFSMPTWCKQNTIFQH